MISILHSSVIQLARRLDGAAEDGEAADERRTVLFVVLLRVAGRVELWRRGHETAAIPYSVTLTLVRDDVDVHAARL
jgi:hypothetical protein